MAVTLPAYAGATCLFHSKPVSCSAPEARFEPSSYELCIKDEYTAYGIIKETETFLTPQVKKYNITSTLQMPLPGHRPLLPTPPQR